METSEIIKRTRAEQTPLLFGSCAFYYSWCFYLLTPTFDFNDALLCFCWCFPSIGLHLSFDFTEMPSPQRFYAEPSPSKRRAFVVSITNLRQLVKSKGKLQSIQIFALDNPLKRFSKSSIIERNFIQRKTRNVGRNPYLCDDSEKSHSRTKDKEQNLNPETWTCRSELT